MIVITAATGQYGRLVVERLLDWVPGGEIAVAVRDPAKAAAWAARGVQVRRGDYDDARSMRAALAGADRVLFISSPEADSDKRIAQHQAVARAAAEARVKHVVYTSFMGAETGDNPLSKVHHATERAIRETGLPYTFPRHALYADVTVIPSPRDAVEAGELVSSTGGRGVNVATRADLAGAAAAVLAGQGHEGKVYELAGSVWSYPDLAAALARVSGRPVAYREVDDTSLPPRMAWFFGLVRSGVLENSTPDLERLLGRPPASLEDMASDALAGSESAQP